MLDIVGKTALRVVLLTPLVQCTGLSELPGSLVVSA